MYKIKRKIKPTKMGSTTIDLSVTDSFQLTIPDGRGGWDRISVRTKMSDIEGKRFNEMISFLAENLDFDRTPFSVEEFNLFPNKYKVMVAEKMVSAAFSCFDEGSRVIFLKKHLFVECSVAEFAVTFLHELLHQFKFDSGKSDDDRMGESDDELKHDFVCYLYLGLVPPAEWWGWQRYPKGIPFTNEELQYYKIKSALR